MKLRKETVTAAEVLAEIEKPGSNVYCFTIDGIGVYGIQPKLSSDKGTFAITVVQDWEHPMTRTVNLSVVERFSHLPQEERFSDRPPKEVAYLLNNTLPGNWGGRTFTASHLPVCEPYRDCRE